MAGAGAGQGGSPGAESQVSQVQSETGEGGYSQHLLVQVSSPGRPLYCTVLHSTVQVSSPGRPLPVKFDFNAAVAVAGDPSIACPVPLRVSPDSPAFHHESSGTESRGKDRKYYAKEP